MGLVLALLLTFSYCIFYVGLLWILRATYLVRFRKLPETRTFTNYELSKPSFSYLK